jgi:hypothetical protein
MLRQIAEHEGGMCKAIQEIIAINHTLQTNRQQIRPGKISFGSEV